MITDLSIGGTLAFLKNRDGDAGCPTSPTSETSPSDDKRKSVIDDSEIVTSGSEPECIALEGKLNNMLLLLMIRKSM